MHQTHTLMHVIIMQQGLQQLLSPAIQQFQQPIADDKTKKKPTPFKQDEDDLGMNILP